MKARPKVFKQVFRNGKNREMRIVFIGAVLLSGAAAFIHFSSIVLLLSVFSIVGAFVCGLAVLHSINKNNPLTAKWCGTGRRFDCESVLKAVRFSKYIYPGDIGLAYFS